MIYKQFIEKYCNNCKNKHTDLCNITKTIDNKIKCAQYKENNE